MASIVILQRRDGKHRKGELENSSKQHNIFESTQDLLGHTKSGQYKNEIDQFNTTVLPIKPHKKDLILKKKAQLVNLEEH